MESIALSSFVLLEHLSYFTDFNSRNKLLTQNFLNEAMGIISPPVKYFTDRSDAVCLLWIVYVISVLCLIFLCARLFICALWSPAEKADLLAHVCGV